MSDSENILPANTEQFLPPDQSAQDPLAAQRPASVGASYGHGWQQLKKYFWPLLLIGVIAFMFSAIVGGVISGLGSGIDSALGGRQFSFGVLANLAYQFIIAVPLTYGSLYAYLKAARDEGPEVSDLFVPYQRAFFASVLTNILLTLCIVVGMILLVVPGVIMAVRLSFAPFIVVDEELNATDALRESWQRTKGHFWAIFGTWLLAIPIVLVGLICLIVGVIPAAMWIYLAFTSLYAAASAQSRRERPVAPAMAP